ncbi:E3 ubiquitin-protein ligase DTX3L1 isoform X1 [Anguilla rostrata]|uniref:E3 ubiquitin-protein ligase DTX3L1 isoform X1 n=1 Tax=Anguilla rostrata TaxID=7938 RepID=UPI0030CD753F
MGTIHHKEKWECNQYLNGAGPPANQERPNGGRAGVALKNEQSIVGDQPDGDMKWISLPRSLPCYPHCGTIEIEYNFNDGIQTEKHPNPGEKYYGQNIKAYLPDNGHGRKVVTQLKKAFDQKLVFTVATNNSGEDAVALSDIPLKTRDDTSGPSRWVSDMWCERGVKGIGHFFGMILLDPVGGYVMCV